MNRSFRESAIETDKERLVGGFDGAEDAIELFLLHRERLLDEDGLPGGECFLGEPGVLIVAGRDQDSIDVGPGEDFSIICGTGGSTRLACSH